MNLLRQRVGRPEQPRCSLKSVGGRGNVGEPDQAIVDVFLPAELDAHADRFFEQLLGLIVAGLSDRHEPEIAKAVCDVSFLVVLPAENQGRLELLSRLVVIALVECDPSRDRSSGART